MLSQFCRLLTIVALFKCLFSLSILSHGFEESTYVKTWKGEKTIQSIANRVSKNKKIISYHHRKQRWTSGYVRSAGRSETNCYVKMCLEKDHVSGRDCGGEILCTPAQEFYVPTKNSWLPAAQLQRGDRLFSASGEQKAISHIEFVKQPLTVYILEVEKHHNFFVGKSSVLTHNTALPWECSIIFSIPFGGGTALGCEAGSFFGPVGIIGGAIIGGIIGWFGSNYLNQEKVHDYEALFDIDVIDAYFKADDTSKFSSQNISPCNIFPQPPEDPNKEKTKEKCAYKDITKPRRIPNTKTDITRETFEKTLREDGWKHSKSNDGKIDNYTKDNYRYGIRNVSKSSDGPTVDYYKPGSKHADAKIRLQRG